MQKVNRKPKKCGKIMAPGFEHIKCQLPLGHTGKHSVTLRPGISVVWPDNLNK